MGIALEDFEQFDGLVLEARRRQLLGVFKRWACIDERPFYQAIFLAHLEIGVFNPSTRDSRIPGMERR